MRERKRVRESDERENERVRVAEEESIFFVTSTFVSFSPSSLSLCLSPSHVLLCQMSSKVTELTFFSSSFMFHFLSSWVWTYRSKKSLSDMNAEERAKIPVQVKHMSFLITRTFEGYFLT
jgi:hypothetical protein